MQTIAPSGSTVKPSATAETWEARVRSWCQHCENVGQLTHMIRGARSVQELAIALDVVREAKNPGVAREVIKCL
jgi:hypothetical protein